MVTGVRFTYRGEPDIRGPLWYFVWLIRCQPWRSFRGSLWGTLWMVNLAVPPALLAHAIDDGLRARHTGSLIFWAGMILLSGLASAALSILRHRTMTLLRSDASIRTVDALMRHAVRLGSALPRRVSTGEVVSAGASDAQNIANVLTMVGPGVGAIISYAYVAVALWQLSPLLAVLITLGVPLLAVLIVPLLRRLDRTSSAYRAEQGELTAQAGDLVGGLRVLLGIGGQGLFGGRYRNRSQNLVARGYTVAAVTSWVQALTAGLPAAFVGLVTWLAARQAIEHTLSIGEVVAVYGYAAMLGVPVWFLIEGGLDFTTGRVAARRVLDILRMPVPAAPAHGVDGPTADADLHDPASGLLVAGGTLTVVAAADPADTADIVGRLAQEQGDEAGEVTWGGVPLAALDPAVRRRRLLVTDHDAYLFAGTLRSTLAGAEPRDDAQLMAALTVAAAEDVVAGLREGLDAPIDTQAGNLSGGQRQRLRLARAILAEPDVLVLIEPTSALDAHTEDRVAGRLAAHRQGRTTVVVTHSPLLLHRAEAVTYVRDGKVVDTGTHAALLARQPGYRRLVARDIDDERDNTNEQDDVNEREAAA